MFNLKVVSFRNQRFFLFRRTDVSDWSQLIPQLPLMTTLIIRRSSLEAVNHLQRANRIFFKKQRNRQLSATGTEALRRLQTRPGHRNGEWFSIDNRLRYRMDARPTGKLILILGELRPSLAWPDTWERLIGPTKARDSAHPPPIERTIMRVPAASAQFNRVLSMVRGHMDAPGDRVATRSEQGHKQYL